MDIIIILFNIKLFWKCVQLGKKYKKAVVL